MDAGPRPPQEPYIPPPGGESASYYTDAQSRSVGAERGEQTLGGWVQGAIRRTPSPQQFFDQTSKHISAGVAAVGAVAGAALSSITEEDHENVNGRRTRSRKEREEGFSDHERWSEEADEKERVVATSSESRDAVEKHAESFNASVRSGREDRGKGRAKKNVAVVVSAESGLDADDEDPEYRTEHASILSHLPSHHNAETTEMFVLIYAPHLTSLPPSNYQPSSSTPGAPGSALGSSYSAISTPAQTPGEELASISPRIEASDGKNKMFDALYQQALTLVSHPTQIMPFTTPSGYVQMLRQLAPQMVYLTDSLSLTEEGKTVEQLKGWVGHTILVVGDEGHGGLADTETEDEGPDGPKRSRWYENSPLVGLGKDVEVVDASRVGDDWARRVGGKE